MIPGSSYVGAPDFLASPGLQTHPGREEMATLSIPSLSQQLTCSPPCGFMAPSSQVSRIREPLSWPLHSQVHFYLPQLPGVRVLEANPIPAEGHWLFLVCGSTTGMP